MSNNNCQFEPSTQTSSATICKWCGQEKWQHNNKTIMSNNKQSMKLYTEEQVRNSMNSMKTYIEKYNENVIDKIIENHIRALGGIETKRTLIIYNTKETTEDEARHLLEILNCDDSTLWDNADHCGVQVLEVPIQGGNNEQQ
jgi:hypothetical protein